MVYQTLGSTAAPLVNKPILTNKKNNKDKTNLNVNNLQVTSSLAKMVKKVVEESKTEEFTPSSSSICNRWTNVLSTSKDKSYEHTFICNSDPEALIYVFGGNSGLTVDMLPRQNNCSVCKDLDTCKNNIKDLYRPGLQKFCDSEEKLKKEVEYSGFNTDIYTYDYVCKKEFDPCYVPLADGSDTDLDSAPLSTPTPTPKSKSTKKKVNEIDSEDTPEDNGFEIMIFLLLLLLIIASIVYKNLFK